MQIENRRCETLRSRARNRRHNDQAVKQMVSSIRDFGFRIPVPVRSAGEVVGVHLRPKAVLTMPLEELSVILWEQWIPAQVRAFWRAVLDGNGMAFEEVRQEWPIASGVEDGRNG